MKKIRIPENLTSMAYRAIKDYILDGKLDETNRLTEEFLARQLGISKSPIREALTRLESERLIRIEPRRGAFLRQFTLKEIADLYDLREALEVFAVSRAVLGAELVSALRESVENSRRHLDANDKRRYIEEDVKFHGLLAGAAGNQFLTETLANVQHQVWLFRRKTYDLSRSHAVASHTAIVRALDKGRREEAAGLMRDHVREVRERLLSHLAEQPPPLPTTRSRKGA